MKINNKKGLGMFALFITTLAVAIVAGKPFVDEGLIGEGGKYAVELKDVHMDGTTTTIKYASDINS